MYHTISKLPFPRTLLLLAGMTLSAPTFSGEPRALEESSNDNQFANASKVEYTGVAEVGSPVHDWISGMVPTTPNYAIPYAIEVSGELAREGFAGPEEFVLFAVPQPRQDGKQATGQEGSTTENWDPVELIPMPSEPGTEGSTNSGTQCGVMFGWPPQQANIDYTWEWRQSDSNGNGVIDPQDDWGWHLSEYTVNFPQEAQGIDC